MNFFRLRVINTLLFFLIGIVLGFILKEKFYPASRPSAQPAYQASFPAGPETPPAAQPEAEEPADEPYAAQDAENDGPAAHPEPDLPPPSVFRAPAAVPEAEELVIEPAPAAVRDAKRRVVKGEESGFFKNPAAYEDRELEMELQMIMAKKSQRGWRVNLVYSGPGRKTDYLYVEDTELLGEKPDLRIGYVYKIRFLCGKGETASGNSLLEISATGEKAAWATGITAVE